MSLKILFNEDTRVKLPATIHFLRLGYQYRSYSKALENSVIDFKTKIFIDSFKKGISKINNKEYSDEEIKAIVEKIHSVISNNDLGKEFYSWLINPIDKPCLQVLLGHKRIDTTLPSMTFDAYYDLDVNIPSINYQNRLTKILNAIDYKIEINNRINDNLCY